MSLEVEYLALEICIIDLCNYLYNPGHKLLPLIRELPQQFTKKLYALFLRLHNHHLIVGR